MGGMGSGAERPGKRFAERCLVLDISTWSREGILREGESHKGIWPREQPVIEYASNLTVRDPYVQVHYTPVDAASPIGHHIRLVATRPHYGGTRWWFICPHTDQGIACGRRVRKLYLPPEEEYLACRRCHRLDYVVQSQSKVGRAMTKARKARLHLRGDVLAGRPKGMWRRTYERLRQQAGSAEEDSSVAVETVVVRARKTIDLFLRTEATLKERASDPSLTELPGGHTGLLLPILRRCARGQRWYGVRVDGALLRGRRQLRARLIKLRKDLTGCLLETEERTMTDEIRRILVTCDTDYRRLWEIVEARAQDPNLRQIAGGSTGLIGYRWKWLKINGEWRKVADPYTDAQLFCEIQRGIVELRRTGNEFMENAPAWHLRRFKPVPADRPAPSAELLGALGQLWERMDPAHRLVMQRDGGCAHLPDYQASHLTPAVVRVCRRHLEIGTPLEMPPSVAKFLLEIGDQEYDFGICAECGYEVPALLEPGTYWFKTPIPPCPLCGANVGRDAFAMNQSRGRQKAAAEAKEQSRGSSGAPKVQPVQCRQVMIPNPTWCEGHASLAAAKRMMAEGNLKVLPIVQMMRLLGVITEQHLVRCEQRDPYWTSAAEVMTAAPTCGPEDSCKKALQLMEQSNTSYVAITDTYARIVGMIYRDDVELALKSANEP